MTRNFQISGIVCDETATRYLDALEAEGKIEQVGDTGRGVSYRKK